jgi:steroid delta-isomerase-like uncharacterized protein
MPPVVAAYLAALNAADPDAVAACVSDDFANEHTAQGAVPTHDRVAYRERLPGFFALLPGLHYRVEDVVQQQERVVVAYELTAQADGPDGVRRPLAVRGVFRLHLHEGRITRRVDYWDQATVARQLAPPP